MTWLGPALVALPLAAAALLVAVLDRIPRRAAEAIAVTVAVLALTGCIALVKQTSTSGTNVVWFGGWHPGNTVGLGIAFAIDLAGAAMATLVATIVLAATLYSRQYFDEVGTIFYVLLLANLGAMLAFSFAADAFNLFVFYEVFSVAAYALSAYRIERKSAFAGALQFAITNTVAGLFILFGIILLEGRTGELNLAAIGHSLLGQHARDTLTATSFAFVTAGLFTRGALAPLHFWFDEVHANAPTPLCAILSGAMVPLALYGFVRIYWSAYAAVLSPTPLLKACLLGFGILSALLGSLMCLREPHLKRALAYCTVAHAGVAVCAFGAFSAAALGGAALYVAGYALAAAALFMAIGILRARTDSVDLRRIAGCGRRLPLTALVFGLATAGIAGVWSVARSVDTPLTIVVGAATGGAFARAFFTVFIARQARPAQRRGVPWFMLAPALVLAVLPLALSMWGGTVRLAAAAAYRLADRAAYEAALLGPGVLPLRTEQLAPLPLLIFAPLGALLVAWLALARVRPLARLRVRLQRNSLLEAIARLHDGNSGQYVAWIVAAATVAALLTSLSIG